MCYTTVCICQKTFGKTVMKLYKMGSLKESWIMGPHASPTGGRPKPGIGDPGGTCSIIGLCGTGTACSTGGPKGGSLTGPYLQAGSTIGIALQGPFKTMSPRGPMNTGGAFPNTCALSCRLHLALRFWNQTCSQKEKLIGFIDDQWMS